MRAAKGEEPLGVALARPGREWDLAASASATTEGIMAAPRMQGRLGLRGGVMDVRRAPLGQDGAEVAGAVARRAVPRAGLSRAARPEGRPARG